MSSECFVQLHFITVMATASRVDADVINNVTCVRGRKRYTALFTFLLVSGTTAMINPVHLIGRRVLGFRLAGSNNRLLVIRL